LKLEKASGLFFFLKKNKPNEFPKMELARADHGPHGPNGPHGPQWPNGLEGPYDPHALYARLGFIIVSAKMSAAKSKSGEWKKNFAFPRGWQNKTDRAYDTRVSGFALVTGAKSGTTAIDIDDPETAQNKRLMALMTNCTLVARTKKGYHYVYGYDARILQTTGDKLDTRNDGGCIFVAPSVAYDDERRPVADYKWIRVPRDDESLVPVPESVIEFLRAIDRVNYVSGSSTAPTAPKAKVNAHPTAPAALALEALLVSAPPTAPPTAAARNAELMAQALEPGTSGTQRASSSWTTNPPYSVPLPCALTSRTRAGRRGCVQFRVWSTRATTSSLF
jgi:hypothetical protein